MLSYLKIGVFAAAVSFLITPAVRILSHKVGAIDVPKDDRRMHTKPTPRLGGLAIYFSVLLSMVVFMWPLSKELQAILLGGSIIVVSGYLDDTKGLTPSMKVLFQLIAALIAVYGGIHVETISNFLGEKGSVISLGFISYPITVLWIIGVTNAINLIDGLDGLADGISAISAISLAIISYMLGNLEIGMVCLIIAGACLGFLPYNFNPASIFMGDTGALLLGYLFAVITIEGVLKTAATVAVVVPVIILAVPISDTLFAIIRRTLGGQSFATADKGHLHHRILDMGFTTKQTVLILYSLAIILGILAVIVSLIGGLLGNLLALGIIIIITLGARRIGMFEPTSKTPEEE
ncbi:MAG: undecaprenyl/decaprenyl-phosphate alpha-N-acetylglucosaminyl 1-phosphate transferase [Tissierellia bacterium]|nr:undecaprenyl/decaprenyl-phosphate alpha-N-acetylglucosaminyl 1-phosphate transferase [Tissierellia bacterium]